MIGLDLGRLFGSFVVNGLRLIKWVLFGFGLPLVVAFLYIGLLDLRCNLNIRIRCILK